MPEEQTQESSPDDWTPPAGPELLRRLRGDERPRPVVDTGLAGGLREWLEDGLSEAIRGFDTNTGSLRVSKNLLTWALESPDKVLIAGTPNQGRQMTAQMARGILVDALFRQWVTLGKINDPIEDGLSALRADRKAEAVDFIEGLPQNDLALLNDEVALHAHRLVQRWPKLAPGWLPRTQDRITIPFCGGAILLNGVLDLVIGAPSRGRASIGLVEVKSGARRVNDRADLHFYGLLETLRSGAPPFRVATYYTRTGELDAEELGDDLLTGAVSRTLDAVSRLCMVGSTSVRDSPQ